MDETTMTAAPETNKETKTRMATGVQRVTQRFPSALPESSETLFVEKQKKIYRSHIRLLGVQVQILQSKRRVLIFFGALNVQQGTMTLGVVEKKSLEWPEKGFMSN